MDIEQTGLHNVTEVRQTDLFGNERVTQKLSMKDRLGFLPTSVWEPDWSITKRYKALIGDDGSTRNLVAGNVQSLPGGAGVSIFNPHLAIMILSAYCPPEAYIFDPFGGGGTRGLIASAMGYRYLGVEIREDEVRRIHGRMAALGNEFTLECADSRTYPVEEGAFDFCYTCPPYYDLEVYSRMPEDMSSAGTYAEFLAMLKESMATTYRALKGGSTACWVVGNFRDKRGRLVHFNGDLVRIAHEVGFALHDELIWKGASNVALTRSGQFEANRKSVRVHEYVVVLKKPL